MDWAAKFLCHADTERTNAVPHVITVLEVLSMAQVSMPQCWKTVLQGCIPSWQGLQRQVTHDGCYVASQQRHWKTAYQVKQLHVPKSIVL